MKIIYNIWDKFIGIIDDIAAQLGLQPKPIPVRVKKNNKKKK